MNEIAWPIKVLIYLHQLRASGYVRITERDLLRQWENLRSSIRVHLTWLERRGLVELSAVSPENCFVRLTEAGIAFVEEGARLANEEKTTHD